MHDSLVHTAHQRKDMNVDFASRVDEKSASIERTCPSTHLTLRASAGSRIFCWSPYTSSAAVSTSLAETSTAGSSFSLTGFSLIEFEGILMIDDYAKELTEGGMNRKSLPELQASYTFVFTRCPSATDGSTALWFFYCLLIAPMTASRVANWTKTR